MKRHRRSGGNRKRRQKPTSAILVTDGWKIRTNVAEFKAIVSSGGRSDGRSTLMHSFQYSPRSARRINAARANIRTVADIADAHGLLLRDHGTGRHYARCPRCSDQRSAAGQRLHCLSILIDADGMCWRCHHCGWHDGECFFHSALSRRGRPQLRPAPPRRRSPAPDDQARIELARGIWDSSVTLENSPAEAYLRGRGIIWPHAPWGRFHPTCPRGRGKVALPALVAAVTVPTRGELRGVHRIYLRADGSGKADLPRDEQKRSLGPTSGAAVVIGDLDTSGRGIFEGEGIETTASVCMAINRPGIATLSASTLGRAPLPAGRAVVILADRGAEVAAQKGARIRLAEGRRVWIAVPPDGTKDFNDLLRAGGVEAVRAALRSASEFHPLLHLQEA